MDKVKGIILDVDGVIVGEKIGFNSPNPHIDVINKLPNISDEQYRDMCQKSRKIYEDTFTFDQFKKIDVNGKNELPLYTYLKSQKKSLLGKNIKWNFTKFIIDREGNVVGRYEPVTTPEKLDAIIAGLL